MSFSNSDWSFLQNTAISLKPGSNPNPLPSPTPFQMSSCNFASGEQPDLMEFNGQLSSEPKERHHVYSNDYLPTFTNHFKRRSSSPPLPTLPPAKQLITEEKIAAHFNSMSISNSASKTTLFAEYSEIPTDDMDQGASTSTSTKHLIFDSSKQLEEKLKKAQRIIVCDEVRHQLNEATNEPIVPKVLLDMERSKCSTGGDCKALILWEPSNLKKLTGIESTPRREAPSTSKSTKSSISSFIVRKSDRNASAQNNAIDDDEEFDNNNISNFNNNNNNNLPSFNENNNNMMDMDDL